MLVTEYSIRAKTNSEDLRAAAAACNKALGDAGETTSIDAAKSQLESCAECWRDGLYIEEEQFEIWLAWVDGEEDSAEMFRVPAGSTVDIAEAAADALGVDVSEKLNMRRA